MKKILFTVIAILFVAVLSSCTGNVSDTEHAVVTKNEKIVEYTEIHKHGGSMATADACICSVRHFKYKNHKYIQFTSDEGAYSAIGGIVHDPDCHCKQTTNQ